MACVNAAGRTMPPQFVVKGKTSKSLHGFNTSAAPVGTRAKNDHPEREVVVIGPHIEQGIPLQTTFLLYCRSFNRSFA
jgi:hypothetical protein